jgi:hypothetical protein
VFKNLKNFHQNDERLETKVAISNSFHIETINKMYLEMLRKGFRKGSPF